MIWLLFLHHLADTAFQPNWMIEKKSQHAFTVYEHAFVWAGTVSFGLYWLGKFSFGSFLFLLIGHFVIDYFKYRYFKNYNWIYLDQALHYLQIIIVYL
jgi:hypothetical protein